MKWNDLTPAKQAYLIAMNSKTWKQAVAIIVKRGLAQDQADADALIREGEEDGNY